MCQNWPCQSSKFHHTVELYIVELQTVLANDREQAILGRTPVAEPAPIPRGQHAQQRPPSGSKTSHRLPPMRRTSTHRRPSGATRGACFVVPGETARVRGPKPSNGRRRRGQRHAPAGDPDAGDAPQQSDARGGSDVRRHAANGSQEH